MICWKGNKSDSCAPKAKSASSTPHRFFNRLKLRRSQSADSKTSKPNKLWVYVYNLWNLYYCYLLLPYKRIKKLEFSLSMMNSGYLLINILTKFKKKVQQTWPYFSIHNRYYWYICRKKSIISNIIWRTSVHSLYLILNLISFLLQKFKFYFLLRSNATIVFIQILDFEYCTEITFGRPLSVKK